MCPALFRIISGNASSLKPGKFKSYFKKSYLYGISSVWSSPSLIRFLPCGGFQSNRDSSSFFSSPPSSPSPPSSSLLSSPVVVASSAFVVFPSGEATTKTSSFCRLFLSIRISLVIPSKLAAPSAVRIARSPTNRSSQFNFSPFASCVFGITSWLLPLIISSSSSSSSSSFKTFRGENVLECRLCARANESAHSKA